jgi:hypothetical protein
VQHRAEYAKTGGCDPCASANPDRFISFSRERNGNAAWNACDAATEMRWLFFSAGVCSAGAGMSGGWSCSDTLVNSRPEHSPIAPTVRPDSALQLDTPRTLDNSRQPTRKRDRRGENVGSPTWIRTSLRRRECKISHEPARFRLPRMGLFEAVRLMFSTLFSTYQYCYSCQVNRDMRRITRRMKTGNLFSSSGLRVETWPSF